MYFLQTELTPEIIRSRGTIEIWKRFHLVQTDPFTSRSLRHPTKEPSYRPWTPVLSQIAPITGMTSSAGVIYPGYPFTQPCSQQFPWIAKVLLPNERTLPP